MVVVIGTAAAGAIVDRKSGLTFGHFFLNFFLFFLFV